MNTYVLSDYCGDNSPLLINFSDDVDQSMFLSKVPPPPKYMTTPELLQCLCGPWDGVVIRLEDLNFYFNDAKTVQWFSDVDQYLDIPIIKFLVKHKFDYNDWDWWLHIAKVKGCVSFLNRLNLNILDDKSPLDNVYYKYQRRSINILVNKLIRKGHLHILEYLVSKGVIYPFQ